MIFRLTRESRFLIDLNTEKVGEFLEVQTSIAIRINPSHDSERFLLSQVVAKTAEEILQVVHMDGALIVSVYGTESRIG